MGFSRRGALISGGAALVGVAAGAGYEVATRAPPEPPEPAAIDAQGRPVWRNWSGLQHAYPAEQRLPRDEAELAAILKSAAAPIRPAGSGHAFTALVPTNGTLVSLGGLGEVLAWDGDAVIVGGGARLDALGAALAARGRALVNPPDDGEATLAGALATGARGAGAALSALHAQVTALRLVTSRGEVIDCDARQRAEVFQAAKVSLGALGVVTRVTLKTAAACRLERRTWMEPLDLALGQAEARWARHRDFELQVIPFTGRVLNVSGDETDALVSAAVEPEALTDRLKTLRDRLGFAGPLRRLVGQALLARLHPTSMVEAVGAFRPAGARYNAMEFHLPVAVQLKALAEVVTAIEKHSPKAWLPIVCRRTAPDEAWLSPFQGQATGSIAVRADRRDDLAFLYTVVEPIFRRHGGRPHWGQLHSVTGDQLAGLYPNWKDFLKVRAALDPEGRMLNPYLTGLFGL